MWDIHRPSAACFPRRSVHVLESRRGFRLRVRRISRLEPLESRTLLSSTSWTVNSLGDSGTGSGTSGDLRYVITQADQTPGANTINFTVTGTITLNSALPDLSNTTGLMDIEGPGASSLNIARNSALGTPDFRIFTVDASVDVKLVGLTLTGGLSDTDGAGLFNAGVVTLINSVVSDNSTSVPGVWTNDGGGGIYNFGAMTLTNCTVMGNSTNSYYALGGGIYNSGAMTLDDSTVSDNSATEDSGGGICNSNGGVLIVTTSTVDNNSTDGLGGGICLIANSTATLTDASVVGNKTTGTTSGGGGVFVSTECTLSLNASVIANNATTTDYGGRGGGILNSGTLNLMDSTVSGNQTVGESSPGGGIDNQETVTLINSSVINNSTAGTYSTGGGMNNEANASMTLINSSVTGNSTAGTLADGGGIYNQLTEVGNGSGSLTLTNSTVSNNSTTGNDASGGGIYNGLVLNLTDCTVSGNSAGGVGSYGGGIDSESGFPFCVTTIVSTIVAGNSATLSPDIWGYFHSQGYDLIGNSDGSAGWTATDLLNVDPMLGPLQNNGGPTMTMALLPGSPAIDAGVAILGITTDQRGVSRPQGTAPDIGAYESPYVTPFVSLAQPTITYGTADVTLSGVISAGTQIPTGSVAITLNGTTQSAVIDSSTGRFSSVFTTSALHVETLPYQITYSYAGGDGVDPATAIKTLSVVPADLTITAVDKTAAFGADPPVLTAGYSGFVNGDSAASLTQPAVLSTTAVAYSAPGSYAILVSGAASPDYAITFVNGTLTVAQPLARHERGGVAFVTTMYLDVLARSTEPEGLRFWIGRINVGARAANIADQIWTSKEHRSLVREHAAPKISLSAAYKDSIRAWKHAARSPGT